MKLRKIILNLKLKGKQTLNNKKKTMRNSIQKFRQSFSEAKKKPRSKRKSLLLGFTTVLTIFGGISFVSALPAVAKDTPKKAPKPGPVCPVPPPAPKPVLVPTKQGISTGLSGVGGTICALAITSGSFMIGSLCGLIVVVGILHFQARGE